MPKKNSLSGHFFFYIIIDAAANNAYILLRKAGEYNYQKSVFEKTGF